MAKTPNVPAKPNQAGVPDYLRNVKVDNRDNFDASDVVIPRIKLLQGLSKEVEAFSNAKAGIFWHTGLDMPLGDQLRFVICSRNKKMLLVAPIEDGQGVLARADDCKTWNRLGKFEVKVKGQKKPQLWEIDSLDVANSSVAKWGSRINDDEDSPPAATMFYDYLVLCPDFPELGPSLISMARSQVKKAKSGINQKIELHKAASRPMQAIMFQAKAVDDQSDGQSFKNWDVTQAGFAPEELFNQAVGLKDVLSTGAYKANDEGELGGEGGAGGGRQARRGAGSQSGADEEI